MCFSILCVLLVYFNVLEDLVGLAALRALRVLAPRGSCLR